MPTKILVSILMCMLLSGTVHAATLYSNATLSTGTDVGYWMDVNIWTTSTTGTTKTNYLPGATASDDGVAIGRVKSEKIILNGNANSGTGAIGGTLNLGYADKSAELAIETGGSLVVGNNINLGVNGQAYTTANITMTGGSLKIETNNSLQVGIGTSSNAASKANLNISGNAQLDVWRITVGGAGTGYAAGALEIKGSSAKVGTRDMVELRENGSISFVADANGFTKLEIGTYLQITATAIANKAPKDLFKLDLWTYAGGTQNFTLIDATTNQTTTNTFFSNQDNLDSILEGAAYDPSKYALGLLWDSANYDLILTVTAIPEPSTYAAIAILGALALVIYRRRKS